ncbi:alcohol dehydrogenase catalytic domain-containing protein [Devosia salina]|uniref:Alcohol dehydrogenase catalytic domain-containing protein n=2 Tax=Devosia salina TaxID=2860336 RepID=A0ABX8WJJ8_9HYPH|nr:alcohol dehydrogenase catalytic domain-containing protein [Devosia salina]
MAAFYAGQKSFRLEEVVPVAPGPGEVQIDVAYCGVCGTDMHVFHGDMDARVTTHRIIGHEMSGVIAAVGAGVEHIRTGQRVVVRPLDHCGDCPACRAGHSHICHNLKFLGLDSNGAFQQKWTVPAHTVHVLPQNLDLKLAAMVEPLAVACHDVRRGRIAAGEIALVIGGGPIGMLIALVAAHAGANAIVAEINENRLAIARKLELETINPKDGAIGPAIMARTDGRGADVVFEVSGSQAGVEAMTAAAAARGRIVMVAINNKRPPVDLFQFFWRELEMLGARVYEPEDYNRAIELLESGAVDVAPLITDIRGLDEIEQAFTGLEGNSNAMKTLIQVGAGT